MKHYKDMSIKEQIRVDIVGYIAIVAVKFSLPETSAGQYEGLLIDFFFFIFPIYIAFQFYNLWKDKR